MKAAKADANQAALVNAFRGLGCSVESLHRVGKGCPDLVVGCAGMTLLVEVKGEKSALNDEQKAWHSAWRGQVCVVRTIEDVGRLVKAARELMSMRG